MIVKVQLPVASDAGNPPLLMYDATYRVHEFLDYASVSPQVIEILEQAPNGKAYFKTRFVNGAYVISDRVQDQPW